jgi:hypothetical protein
MHPVRGCIFKTPRLGPRKLLGGVHGDVKDLSRSIRTIDLLPCLAIEKATTARIITLAGDSTGLSNQGCGRRPIADKPQKRSPMRYLAQLNRLSSTSLALPDLLPPHPVQPLSYGHCCLFLLEAHAKVAQAFGRAASCNPRTECKRSARAGSCP